MWPYGIGSWYFKISISPQGYYKGRSIDGLYIVFCWSVYYNILTLFCLNAFNDVKALSWHWIHCLMSLTVYSPQKSNQRLILKPSKGTQAAGVVIGFEMHENDPKGGGGWSIPGVYILTRKLWQPCDTLRINEIRPYSILKHRICCGETKIVWGANIREGKYLTHELRPKDFRLLGNIIGVMLQVCDKILDQ